ncbi:MAG: alcohol dehydrogenase [Comamonadaceae bacterium PBBC2]|nr:MAG: alcohol dehydrogenase [Comamonadaceae bacterium PBBC2]
MKAVVCRNGQLTVQDRPEPRPGPGQVLLKVLRCGICGSDLHIRHHCDAWGALMARSGYTSLMRADQEVVFGHEFSGEVLEYGPGCKRSVKPGTHVVASPALRVGTEIDMVGLSARIDGAYAERVVVQETSMFPIPNGLSPDLAALTEPMAVGMHALRCGNVKRSDVAVVIGCGPVGLAIICLLKARDVETIVASDFSPGRRKLASACGAHIVVDPAVHSPYAHWQEFGFIKDVPATLELMVSTREKLGRLPLPWWHTWRLAELLAGDPKGPVVFECVGAPGVLQNIIEGVPQFARIVVVGVCMQSDRIENAVAINKATQIRFSAGYSPLEFRETLHAIAYGTVDCSRLITGEVGLGGVDAAFTALGDPETHAKILIDPQSSVTLA